MICMHCEGEAKDACGAGLQMKAAGVERLGAAVALVVVQLGELQKVEVDVEVA